MSEGTRDTSGDRPDSGDRPNSGDREDLRPRNLWAPWRIQFIRGDKGGECVFCAKPAELERLRENLVLHRGQHSFVIMNLYPYNNGHLMVVPYLHTMKLSDLTRECALEIHELLTHATHVLREKMNAEGFNIGLNLGAVAGAGIRDHLHYHIVPRWAGDTNFMPVIGQTKTIPQHILEAYDQLKTSFEA